LWPNDAGNDQFPSFETDANLLVAFDHQMPFGSTCMTTAADIGQQFFLAIDRAFAFAQRVRARCQDAAG